MTDMITVEYNFSRDFEYHSQRNNRLIPLSSCGVTSDVMAMKQAGWPVESPEGVQPEDMLSDFLLNSKFAVEAQRKFAPWAAGIPRNQVHVMMIWAMNRLFGGEEWSLDGPVARFRTNVWLPDMLRFVARGYGIVLSGTFDLPGGKELNHLVSLAGFGWRTAAPDVPLEAVIQEAGYDDVVARCPYVIIDDPYGDYHTLYRDHRGNDVKVPLSDFLSIFKPVSREDAKWSHVIYPYGGA